MKKILVPCDFSETAMDALKFAIELARSANAALHLLHVIEFPPVYESVMVAPTNTEARLMNEFRHHALDKFNAMMNDPAADGVAISVEVQAGGVCPVILEVVNRQGIDLVIMGSYGARGFRELLIGSNAEKVVKRSPVPVLVVKHAISRAIKHIVFPNALDIPNQDALVDEVKSLQALFDAQLHIVWINTPLNFMSDRISHEKLNEFVRTYALRNYTTHVFNHNHEEGGILAFTRLIDGDLIALGTHGRTGVEHVLYGSLAEDLVNHGEWPVWSFAFGREVHA